MALIKCSECGKEVSSEAVNCPHCGHPLKEAKSVVSQKNIAAEKPKKKKRGCLITMIVIFIAIGIISVALSQSLNNDKEAGNKGTTSKEDVISFGKEGKLGDLSLTVNEVKEVEKISAAGGLMAYTPKSGKYALVNLTIKNKSKESVSLLISYFKLIGPDDAEYVPTIIAVADDDFITVDTINPNLEITGNLVFEIPKDLKVEECILKYSDFDLFSGIFKFKLK